MDKLSTLSQVTFRKEMSVPALGTPEYELKEVIRSCLSGKPQHRPTASQVESRLQTIMRHQGWSDSLLDA